MILILNIWKFRCFLNNNLKPEIIKELTGDRNFLLSDLQAEEYFKACLEEVERNESIELKGSVTKSGRSEGMYVYTVIREYYECENFYDLLTIYKLVS